MVRGFAVVLVLCVLGAAARIAVGAERDTVLVKSPGNPLVSFRLGVTLILRESRAGPGDTVFLERRVARST